MPVDDVKILWQSQPKELEVRMEEIRNREESLEALARRQAMVSYGRAALFFAIAVFNVIAGRHPITDRLTGVLWFAWGLGLVRRGRQIRKQLGPRRFAPDVVLRTSLEGYRNELEHARDFIPGSWEFLALALVIGTAAKLALGGSAACSRACRLSSVNSWSVARAATAESTPGCLKTGATVPTNA